MHTDGNKKENKHPIKIVFNISNTNHSEDKIILCRSNQVEDPLWPRPYYIHYQLQSSKSVNYPEIIGPSAIESYTWGSI